MAASLYKWLLPGIVGFFHPFFVSVTEINHNAKEKELEISCKIFLDDVEKALKKQLNTSVDLSNPKDKKSQQLVSEYIKKHLQIKADGKALNLEFIGYEIEGASLWSYFQVPNIAAVQKLDVTNNILYEMFEGQISIVHAQVGGTKKSNKVINPETSLVFSF